jgi:hypothetical protein
MRRRRNRIGKAGVVRYTAYYDDHRGRRRSAGTFANKKAADAAWRNAEALLSAGQPGDPRAGQLRFASYVSEQWLPNHVMEPTTRQSYRYNYDRHITLVTDCWRCSRMPICRRRANSSPKNHASATRPSCRRHTPTSRTSMSRPVAGIPKSWPVC